MTSLTAQTAAPQSAAHRAHRLATTPAGKIRITTHQGEREYGTGSLTAAQIAAIQGHELQHGGQIEWAGHADEIIKDRRPGPFTLAWTDLPTGRVRAATWDTKGRVKTSR